MSNLYDPYRPPTNADYGSGPSGGGPSGPQGDANVSEAVQTILRDTRPWATFMGVLGLVGVGLMVLMGLVTILAGALSPTKLPAAAGIFYLVLAGIYVYPAICLLRFGSSIRRFLASPDQDTLAFALGEQRSFWRYAGITAIVMMVLYALVIVAGIVGVALMSAGARM